MNTPAAANAPTASASRAVVMRTSVRRAGPRLSSALTSRTPFGAAT
jgi:hypothetical protein